MEEQDKPVTVFLKGGGETQIAISEIEYWFEHRLDEMEPRYRSPKPPRPEGIRDDVNPFPEPDK